MQRSQNRDQTLAISWRHYDQGTNQIDHTQIRKEGRRERRKEDREEMGGKNGGKKHRRREETPATGTSKAKTVHLV